MHLRCGRPVVSARVTVIVVQWLSDFEITPSEFQLLPQRGETSR